jgi:Acetyltransferase (GNAT) domain
LDAATDGNWQLLQTASDSGFRGEMPIYLRNVFGHKIICLPPLTHTLGPTIIRLKDDDDRSGRVPPRIHRSLLRELIGQLPGALMFSQVFDPSCGNLIEFHLNGFSIEVMYTFRIDDCTDTDAVWKGMRDKTRNAIRRAADGSRIEWSSDIGGFVEFYAASLANAGQRMQVNPNRMRAILDAAVEHNSGTAIFCRDARHAIVASVFLLWDDTHCYYYLSARDRRLAGGGAVSLSIWEAIRFVGRRGLGFDFDAFNSIGAAKFLSQFGAQVVPRWRVCRMAPVYRALLALGAGRLLRSDA